jgi:hypothetical protein
MEETKEGSRYRFCNLFTIRVAHEVIRDLRLMVLDSWLAKTSEVHAEQGVFKMYERLAK